MDNATSPIYPSLLNATPPIAPDSNTTQATPRLAPELIPNTDGPASGFHRQQQQGQRIGNDRASDGDRDGLVAGDAQFADDGVGDQGLRGEESGQQDRGVDRKSQDVISRQNTEQERNTERIESEYEASGAVLAEIRHVHIQAGEEHDVEQSGRTGEDDAAVLEHTN